MTTKAYPKQLTVGGGAYSANDNVGGLLDLRILKNKTLKAIRVTDASDQKADLRLYLLRELPAGTFTNNAALTLTEANAKLVVGVVDIAAADYTLDLGAISLADVAVTGLAENVQYGLLEAIGTPTYAGTDDLHLTFIAEAVN